MTWCAAYGVFVGYKSTNLCRGAKILNCLPCSFRKSQRILPSKSTFKANRTKIALITGGSRGLGKNMVLQLAGKGHDIILTYNSNKTEAEKVVDEVRAMGRNAEAYQLDTTDIKSFDGFLKEVSAHLKKYTGSGNFDILINNAGTGANYPVADTPEDVFDHLYQVHLKGV